jgi:hypothetical protein
LQSKGGKVLGFITSLYSDQKTDELSQASLDIFAAGVGLSVLRAFGLKFEVGRIPFKTLLVGGGLVGLSGAISREILNWCSGDQNIPPLKLIIMITVAIGMVILSQAEPVRNFNLPYLGKPVSLFPQFASQKQMFTFAAFSGTAMVGFRYYFDSTSRG